MTKAKSTPADRLAALKARDVEERRERLDLDATTLPVLLEKARAALALLLEMEALCGDLVSDSAHAALKAQAGGGPSGSVANIITLAETAQTGVAQMLTILDAADAAKG